MSSDSRPPQIVLTGDHEYEGDRQSYRLVRHRDRLYIERKSRDKLGHENWITFDYRKLSTGVTAAFSFVLTELDKALHQLRKHGQ